MKCRYCHGTGEHINDANRMTTCEFCNGTGEVEVVGDSVTDVCDKCGGTGFFCEMRMGDNCTLGSPCPHQKPLTNEEWIKSLDTEQLAEWLSEKFDYCQTMWYWACDKCTWSKKHESCMNDKEKWVEWLKQPHNGE